MLCLTRTPTEGKNTIVLTTPDGQEIRIVVRSISGKQVSLGIDAPREIHALREEVKDDGRK